MNPTIRHQLEQRLGKVHTDLRLGVENDHERQIFGFGRNFFHIENWYSIHGLIRNCFRLAGLHERGQKNACRHIVRNNFVKLKSLPPAFHGYKILHLSDLHVDMYPDATHALFECIRSLDYDLCVMTGDYRARTFGDFEPALKAMEQLRLHLSGDVYGVFGNHDTIQMLPALEQMGYRMLMNESTQITIKNSSIYLAGIDDAHFFRADNIEKAASGQNKKQPSILLSHTPEVYKQAAHAGFDLFLCGHTHGGQICLPGGYPLTLDSACPRFVGKGAWQHQNMLGYTSCGAGTSVVNIRLNCPPEITIHHLHANTESS